MMQQVNANVAEVGVKCPFCGVRFNSLQLVRVHDTGLRNSELRQHVGAVQPLYEHYSVCTCPGCGRAGWANAFERTTEVCVLNQPKVPTHLQYRNAAMGAEKDARGFFNVAMFYLYAAWSADDAGALPQAREYRRLALEAFRKSLMDVSCPADNRTFVEYLIGELMRRTGEFDGCRQYYQQVISRLPGRYAAMARKLMRLAETQNTDLVEFE
jgi:uncharacterized protein (DUF2225 family)